jgi:hypothetical protein
MDQEIINLMIEFEDGNIDEDNLIKLFQYLVNTGHAWKLQGVYGRTAESLIQAGLVNQVEIITGTI